MKCAWCGYIRQKSDDHFVPTSECPSCGNAYGKKGDTSYNAFPEQADVSDPVLRPSPVDEESLKKARERVEKRLKGRLSAQKRDSRHDQTLELARQFASEGVRQRQEQWKQQQAGLQESDDTPTDPSSESPTTEDISISEPEAPQKMTEAVEVNASEVDMTAQQDRDTTPSGSDHRESYLAKAMEKQQQSILSDDTEEAAVKGSTDTSDLSDDTKEAAVEESADASMTLDMESESENTSLTSWSTTSAEEGDAASYATAPDSEPTREDDQPLTSGAHAVSGGGHLRKRRQWVPGGGLARLQPLVAWLILAAGICGAILSWTTLTDAEAGMQTQQMDVGNSMSLGLLLGFAYLVTGVLGFAFFWVSSLISHQLKDIQRLLLLQPVHRSQNPEVEPKPAAEVLQ